MSTFWSTVRRATGLLLIAIGILKLLPTESTVASEMPTWFRAASTVAALLETLAGTCLLVDRFVVRVSVCVSMGALAIGVFALIAGPGLGVANDCGCLGPIRMTHFGRIMIAATLAFLGGLNAMGPTAIGPASDAGRS